ncbi:MAG: glycosyltransferase family 4 protein [Bifidobacteriaceae bacterium]|jgi:glycosyltransferase involved in cell wall biosynthesis|nr:glycosyltransferase family 4 protein [Bifidobacteriaceae bacterium]
MHARRFARRGWRKTQRLVGPHFPALVYRRIPCHRYDESPLGSDSEPTRRSQRLAAVAALTPRTVGVDDAAPTAARAPRVLLVGGQAVRDGLAEAADLVERPDQADLVIVEPSGLTPDEVVDACNAAQREGSASFLWLTGGVDEAEPFLELAHRFDYVFTAELAVALVLARRLGPGRVGVAPLAGRAHLAQWAEPGQADHSRRGGPPGQVGSQPQPDAGSETRLDPELLDQLIATGQAKSAYSRAIWNFFGQALGPDGVVRIDPEAVRREHSYSARLRQMIALATGQVPPGEPWAEIARQLTASGGQNGPDHSRDDSGWLVDPAGWPQGEHSADGGRLSARRDGEDLIWRVEPAKGLTFSLNLRGSLPVSQVSPDGRRLFVELNGKGEMEGHVAVTLIDRAGRVVQSRWYAWNTRHCVILPPEAARVRLAVRALGEGTARFTALRLPDRERDEALPLKSAPSRVLVISDAYPSRDNTYSFGFVHTRIKAYQRAGFEVDVMVPGPGKRKAWREYQGVQVLEGSQWLLAELLESGRYDSAAVHFLKPHLWETLADFQHKVALTIWIHGSDIQPWWRRDHAIHSAQDQEFYEEHTRRLMAMWRPVLGTPASRTRFVLVSQTFAEEVAEDLARLGLLLPAERTRIIHNGIDTDLFSYQPKAPDQRKRILMIRSFANRKYGTDLAAAAIEELSHEPFFSELEFLIVGDGELWEEDMGPLRRFANIRFHRQFLTHQEIAEVQNDFGVMLQPTRWDSQGVSRDEAMSAGLVVISNAVAAVPEFLSESEGYLVAPDDPSGIVRAIEDLYRRPETFAAKSAAAAARVRANLTLDKVARQEIALLKEGEPRVS